MGSVVEVQRLTQPSAARRRAASRRRTRTRAERPESLGWPRRYPRPLAARLRGISHARARLRNVSPTAAERSGSCHAPRSFGSHQSDRMSERSRHRRPSSTGGSIRSPSANVYACRPVRCRSNRPTDEKSCPQARQRFTTGPRRAASASAPPAGHGEPSRSAASRSTGSASAC